MAHFGVVNLSDLNLYLLEPIIGGKAASESCGLQASRCICTKKRMWRRLKRIPLLLRIESSAVQFTDPHEKTRYISHLRIRMYVFMVYILICLVVWLPFFECSH